MNNFQFNIGAKFEKLEPGQLQELQDDENTKRWKCFEVGNQFQVRDEDGLIVAWNKDCRQAVLQGLLVAKKRGVSCIILNGGKVETQSPAS